MENASYTTLTRQSGLMREMQIVANNIANSATTGFRSEDIVFSEHVARVDNGPSISMATANISHSSEIQGTLTSTGGPFDFAIEGEGYFLVQAPAGERLTRAGNFSVNGQGDLVNFDGYPVLDAGGAAIFIPPDSTEIGVAVDGTLSSNGVPLAQLGIVIPVDSQNLVREDGVLFRADSGFDPAENPKVLQGTLENSNVDPIRQVARMIEVQRAYEMGASFLDAENERVRTAVQTLLK